MIRQSIARSYAKGLFAVGEKDGRYEDYLRQMKEILEIVNEAPRIRKALMLPLFEMDKRKELLSAFIERPRRVAARCRPAGPASRKEQNDLSPRHTRCL